MPPMLPCDRSTPERVGGAHSFTARPVVLNPLNRAMMNVGGQVTTRSVCWPSDVMAASRVPVPRVGPHSRPLDVLVIHQSSATGSTSNRGLEWLSVPARENWSWGPAGLSRSLKPFAAGLRLPRPLAPFSSGSIIIFLSKSIINSGSSCPTPPDGISLPHCGTAFEPFSAMKMEAEWSSRSWFCTREHEPCLVHKGRDV